MAGQNGVMRAKLARRCDLMWFLLGGIVGAVLMSRNGAQSAAPAFVTASQSSPEQTSPSLKATLLAAAGPSASRSRDLSRVTLGVGWRNSMVMTKPQYITNVRWGGGSKRRWLARLRHQRQMANSPYPRLFGFVMSWDDQAGEGIILDQEKTQKYLVIRDEIWKCPHNHKTLQRAEMVEFFATDEIDDVSQLPLARNITGLGGLLTKTSEEYRTIMLSHTSFPKKWQDTYDEYVKKVGQYWLSPRWRNAGKPKK